jgi:predicted NodU family carbamoyl transferase
MVLREDVSNYWDIDGDFPYMNIVGYNTTNLFPAAKHVDNTTRIQTVSTMDNLWVYNLLQEVKKLTGHGVIINTSLNTSGQPIINWYSDAISMLKSNYLDALVLEDKLFLRG